MCLLQRTTRFYLYQKQLFMTQNKPRFLCN